MRQSDSLVKWALKLKIFIVVLGTKIILFLIMSDYGYANFLKSNSYLIDGFDYDKSEYKPNISDEGKIMTMNARSWIAKVVKLALNEKVVNSENVFFLHGWIFFNKIFISENVLEKALEHKFYGIRYVEVSKIVEFYNAREYLEKGASVVE